MEVNIATNRTETNVEKSNNNEDKNIEMTTEAPTEHRKQRERRIISPNTTSLLLALEDPASASSSNWSAQALNDATFEPTIEMMVNDFDDEQTLNEEEALAESEQQDPHDEIATLREESEMPIEELLAKYQAMSHMPFPATVPRKKKKKQKHNKIKQKTNNNNVEPTLNENVEQTVSAVEENDNENREEEEEEAQNTMENASENSVNGDLCEQDETSFQDLTVAPSRSYLLDLYPDQNFVATTKLIEDNELPLEALYGGDIQSETDDEPDMDSDYVKKTIMVGSAYQATIPVGLSQYGDVLPYENEDKLIWEPSQVSEREVEEYLLMAREIKPTLCDDEAGLDAKSSDTLTNGEDNNSGEDTFLKSLNGGYEHEPGNVVKDNEQALHLLVQCGYDFKEALRRKRLNALPLTGSMSIWSEEECQKFEEGIQKFGKDFLRIRQNQVRTRTMRELVLFYYLWKKSERHVTNNADSVDHMDNYLNESGNNAIPSGCQTSGTNAQLLPTTNSRARSNSTGSISIMALSQSHAAQVLTNNTLKSAGSRKRNAAGNNTSQLMATVAGTGIVDNEVQ